MNEEVEKITTIKRKTVVSCSHPKKQVMANAHKSVAETNCSIKIATDYTLSVPDMKIEFNKNIQFTKLVKAEGRLREFNFRKINSIKEGLFTVDVSDDRGNRKIFNMKKTDNRWSLVPEEGLPEWIVTNQEKLHDLIEEELQNEGSSQ